MFPTRVNIYSIANVVGDLCRILISWIRDGNTAFENQVCCEASVRVGAVVNMPVAKVVSLNPDQPCLGLSFRLTVHRPT